MTIRFLYRERGRRSLCVTLLLLIEAFIFSPAVFSQQRFARQTFMEALQTGNLASFYDDTKMLAYARGITQAISDFLEENPESEKAGCANLGDPYQYASDVLQKDRNLDNATEFTADGRADLRLLIKDQNGRCDTPTMKAVAYNVWKLIAKPDQQKSAEQIRTEQCVSYGRQLEEVNKAIRYSWNPTPALRSRQKLYEEKIREICPPSSPFRKSVPSAEVRRAQEEESRAQQCRSYRERLEAQNTNMQRYSGNVPPFEQKLKASYERGVREFCTPSSPEQGSSPGTGENQSDSSDSIEYETIMPVKVRNGPGSRYEELGSLSRGARVTVAGWENGWLKIVSKHGKPPGYIPVGAARQFSSPRPTEAAPSSSPSSDPQPEEATPTTEQSAGSTEGKLRGLADYEAIMPIKVRSGPGSQYEELGSLSRGAKISAAEAYTGWLKIFSKHGKPPGYIPLSAVREINPRPTETARSSPTPSVPQSEKRQAKESPPAAPVPSPSGAMAIKETAVEAKDGYPALVEHLLAETDEAQAIAISQSGGARAWCPGSHLIVKLRSSREGVSLKERYAALVPVMLEKLKPVVELECPRTQSMSINLDEKTMGFYSTVKKKADGWEISEVQGEVAVAKNTPPFIAAPLEQQAQEQTQEQPKAPVSAPALSGNAVQDCDAYAAHPDDPERNGARGVEDDSIDAEKAIEVCKAAVEQNPQNGRLLFELGRSYWAGERFEEAIEAFLEAGEQGHGGALAYLGDATLYGVAGMDADPEEAKKLYQRAAAAGFKPAAALADEIVAGVKAVNLQEEQQQTAGGEPNYHKPKAIKYLAEGDWRGYDEMFVPGNGIVYTANIIGGVRYSCPEAIPPGTDGEALFYKKVNRSFNNLFEAAQFSEQYLAGSYDAIAQEGMDDGNAFAVVNGCQSDKTKTFVKTAIRYF